MSLTVLSDEEIRGLLESLTREEAEGLAFSLKSALHEYSTGTQSIEAGLIHQPDRTSIHSNKTNATTLFMPSCSTKGHGVKGMGLLLGSTGSANDEDMSTTNHNGLQSSPSLRLMPTLPCQPSSPPAR